MEQWIKGIGW